MKQVLLRRENLRTGCNDLVRVDVLSEANGMMRIKMPGQFHPVAVEASRTIACSQIRPTAGFQRADRSYNFPGSLARDLNPARPN